MSIITSAVKVTKRISSKNVKDARIACVVCGEYMKNKPTKQTPLQRREHPLDKYCINCMPPVNQVPEPETFSIPPIGCFRAVQLKAYYKWIDAGRPEGRALEFWVTAETEIASRMKCTKR